MAFQLMKFEDLLKMSKEAIDATLAPVRARSVKAKFESKCAELDERRIKLEMTVVELASHKDIDVDKMLDTMDDIALLERRIAQIETVRAQLFP